MQTNSGVTDQGGATPLIQSQTSSETIGGKAPSSGGGELSAEEMASLQENRLELPFDLPEAASAQDWFYEFEAVDVLEGSLDELKALADRAPTPTARSYLLGVILARSSFEMYGPAA